MPSELGSRKVKRVLLATVPDLELDDLMIRGPVFKFTLEDSGRREWRIFDPKYDPLDISAKRSTLSACSIQGMSTSTWRIDEEQTDEKKRLRTYTSEAA